MNALITIAGVGFLALLAEIFNFKKYLNILSVCGMVLALAFCAMEWTQISPYFINMVVFDHYALVFTAVLCIITLLWFLTSFSFFTEDSHQADKTSLVLFSMVGGICMIAYQNLTMLFLGIEILSICMYVLAGSHKSDISSNESALKYFLMGAFATGFLLLGITFIYGATASFDISVIASKMSAEGSYMMYLGVVLMLIGLSFKIGAVPFHFWTPDVYEGAPTPITSYMATIVKTSAFAAFLKLFSMCFPEAIWAKTIVILSALTILVGNLSALYQVNVKRMLAYSGIAQAGYMLMALFLGPQVGGNVLLYYALVYSIATIASFAIIHLIAEQKGNSNLSSFQGIAKNNPLLAATLIICMLSFAGIPPAAGFFAKYYLFSSYLEYHSFWLIAVALLGSVIGVYYYFQIIFTLFKSSDTADGGVIINIPTSTKIALVLCMALLLALGLMPDLVLGIL